MGDNSWSLALPAAAGPSPFPRDHATAGAPCRSAARRSHPAARSRPVRPFPGMPAAATHLRCWPHPHSVRWRPRAAAGGSSAPAAGSVPSRRRARHRVTTQCDEQLAREASIFGKRRSLSVASSAATAGRRGHSASAVTQARKDPALHHLHRRFDLGLVLRRIRPCRQHRDIVVPARSPAPCRWPAAHSGSDPRSTRADCRARSVCGTPAMKRSVRPMAHNHDRIV